MNAGWFHPIDMSDQWDGFNEPGIEHFSGSPTKNLAREVNQNSLDAADAEKTGPVRVRIERKLVPTSSIPHLEGLKKTISLCKKASKNESQKARQFFEVATKELEKPTIAVLEISDTNTRGIAGPAVNGTPYYAFMKAKGQSKKQSDLASGSFGIGKFAPYAVSKLRTVFVSTVYREANGEYRQLTQGKSILMSHDEGSMRHQGIGFWGDTTKCQPIRDNAIKMPPWLVREATPSKYPDSLGTKLSILGFDDRRGWEKLLAASVAENFFGAIAEGKLEVEIVGYYDLTKDTIGDALSDPELLEAIADQKDGPDHMLDTATYLSCFLSGEDVIVEQSQTQYLGLCELRLRIDEGLPKRVCVLRNGMFISDSLALPGLKNFSDFKEFAAVFQCKSPSGAELLRAMEPPRHDDFEPDRLPSPEEQEKGRRALRELSKWIRDMLKRHAKDPVSDVTKIDELKEFFAEEGKEGGGKGNEEVNPYGAIVLRAKPLKQNFTKIKITDSGEDGGDGDSDGGGGGGGGGGGKGQGGATTKPQFPFVNPRAVVTGGARRRLSFTPTKTGNVELSLYEVGADADYEVAIKDGNKGRMEKGRLRLAVVTGVRETVEVLLSEEFDGALKVVAHEL